MLLSKILKSNQSMLSNKINMQILKIAFFCLWAPVKDGTAFRNDSMEFQKYILNRRPQIMGDSLPLSAISPQREKVQQKIEFYHNLLRSKVKPIAGNMLKMNWHTGAAGSAQRWADKCKFLVHDSPIGRHVGDFGPCGQNIFVSTKKVPWLFAIETWWLEKHKFVYGQKNNLSQTGHYSQLVWAASHKLGCGLAKCTYEKNHQEIEFFPFMRNSTRTFYNYVCNYCPIGNRPGKSGIPYKLGPPCSFCKDNCSDKFCTNSCPVANVWINCDFLHRAHPHWLCHTKSLKGKQRRTKCKATCDCKYEIHD